MGFEKHLSSEIKSIREYLKVVIKHSQLFKVIIPIDWEGR